MSWCTIESDPGVFTELVERFGTRGVEFAELYSLDDGELARHARAGAEGFPARRLRTTGGAGARARARLPLQVDGREAHGGAARRRRDAAGPLLRQAGRGQRVRDASDPRLPPDDGVAGRAAPRGSAEAASDRSAGARGRRPAPPQVTLGPALGDLKAFAAELPFDMRGLAIENAETVRAAHNSFARPEPFVSEEKRAARDEDVFHFVTYVPHGGRVFELDGLQAGPVDLGAHAGDWLPTARGAIEARVAKYAASEIKFNLMAVVRDKRVGLEAGRAALAAAGDAVGAADAAAALAGEAAKREAWAAENVRRHHNYVPLAVDLLKALAARGALRGMLRAARDAKAAKAAAAAAS